MHVSFPHELSGAKPQAAPQRDAGGDSFLLPTAHLSQPPTAQPLDPTGLNLTKGFKSCLEGEGWETHREKLQEVSFF